MIKETPVSCARTIYMACILVIVFSLGAIFLNSIVAITIIFIVSGVGLVMAGALVAWISIEHKKPFLALRLMLMSLLPSWAVATFTLGLDLRLGWIHHSALVLSIGGLVYGFVKFKNN